VKKIGQTGQIQKSKIKTVDIDQKQLDVVDILKNSTRFMIHGLLSIYPQLSLGELKEMTGKSKATLVEHLKEMMNSKLVEVSMEEDYRPGMKKKWYALTPEADDETEKVVRKDSGKSDIDNLKDRIETYISFAQTKRNLLENWTEYLTCLSDKIDGGDYEEVLEVMNEMKENHEIFTSSSYYSRELAQIFIMNSWRTYEQLENARRKNAGLPEKTEGEEEDEEEEERDKSDCYGKPSEELIEAGNEIATQVSSKLRKERPYFASVDLIPMKRVFDFKAKQYLESRNLKK